MELDITVARVRGVIEGSGLTQGEFAARAGLDASKMSKALAGVRKFSSLDLANIATVAGVSVDYLLGVDSPQPALAARAAARSQEILSSAVQEARRLAGFRADLAFIGVQAPVRRPLKQPGGWSWLAQAMDLANEALERLSEDRPEEPESFEAALERAFGVDVARVKTDDGCDGLAWRDDHCMLIVVGTTDSASRQRFTMAHELCHLLVGDDQALHVDDDVMHASDVTEKRANAFAAALLMPETQLREWAAGLSDSEPSDVEFAELVMSLRVSPSALSWRLLNLGLVSESRRKQLARYSTAACAQLAGAGGLLARLTEESQRERVPAGLIQDVANAYLNGKMTMRPFANLLRTDVNALRHILEQVDGTEVERTADEPAFAP
ncbi:helix-turn-helix domain-containing protein [Modestobacter sp. VKM Ac-2984]|uniref:helix-turn-helix domain-containing protein n=1 Tax=Modestobacter sp. VKM Ac-2984 TaxID=3004138 RepID=UPI0022AAB4E4|nr:XRE family transcriptional regulator [Modestobacter sp. VKM Ac-2984]MCZ2814921.1 XRE family transcriptional regulator [Modestobacter sp. VKM Ac-2984]